MSFKSKHSFTKRADEADKVKEKYPNRIPVICEINPRDTSTLRLPKMKYLVPDSLTVGQFMYVLRKQMTLKPEEAIFILINDTLPPTASLMSQLYNKHADTDGFLYCFLCKESVFGHS